MLAIGHAFDGLDTGAVDLAERHHARVDDLAIEQDGARPALALAAPLLGTCEVQVFAQDVEQAAHAWRLDLHAVAVDAEPIAHVFTVLMPGIGGGSIPASAASVRSGVAGKVKL